MSIGPPAFRRMKHYDMVDQYELVWAWTPDGETMKDLSEHHACVEKAGGMFGFNGKATDARTALLAGCAAAMLVSFGASNTIVSYMQYTIRDFFGTYGTETKAVEFTKAYIAALEQKDRDAAAKVKIP